MSLETGNATTTIELSNILRPGQSNEQPEDLSNNETQSATYKIKRAVTKNQLFECGVPKVGSTQSLLFGGKAISHGEWPWYVMETPNFFKLISVYLQVSCILRTCTWKNAIYLWWKSYIKETCCYSR